MKKLQSTLLPDSYTDVCHKAFDKLDPWIQDLQQGLPIFSTGWQAPETFDAISAFGFLKDMKRDLTLLVPRLNAALQEPNLPANREATKLLAAAILRSASVRNTYVETAIQVYSALQAQPQVAQISPELPGAQEYSRVAQLIVDTFSSPAAYEDGLCEKLRKEALLTPGDFKAHIHDANILLNAFSKDFTFEMAEFTQGDADEWSTYQIPAVMAGYWRAYDFTPEQCNEWSELGIIAAPLAANWRRAEFEPAHALEWIKEGFTPALALQWNNAGFEPARAAALLRRGITDPAQAPRAGGAEDSSDETQDMNY